MSFFARLRYLLENWPIERPWRWLVGRLPADRGFSDSAPGRDGQAWTVERDGCVRIPEPRVVLKAERENLFGPGGLFEAPTHNGVPVRMVDRLDG